MSCTGLLERADPCPAGLCIVAIFGSITGIDAMYCLLAQALFIAAWFDGRDTEEP